MYRFLSALILIYFCACQHDDPETTFESYAGEIKLHSSNFYNFLKRQKYSYVFFSMHTSSDSQNARVEYRHALQEVGYWNNKEIAFGAVECEQNGALCQKERAFSLPAIMLYVDGKPHELHGIFTHETIYDHAIGIVEREPWKITRKRQMLKIMREPLACILYVKKAVPEEALQQQLDVVREIAKGHLELNFHYAITEDQKAIHDEIDKFSNYTFVLHRHFGNENVTFATNDTWNVAEFEAFIRAHKEPDFYDYNYQVARKVFHLKRNAIFIFYDENDDVRVRDFETVAKEFKQQLLFIKVNTSRGYDVSAMDMLGVGGHNQHIVKILEKEHHEQRRYKLEGEWSADGLRKFVQLFLDKKLEPYHLTEPIPLVEKEGSFKVVVGQTFQRDVIDSKENVLFLLYLKDESKGEYLEEKLEELFESHEHLLNGMVVPMKMEAVMNEHPTLKVTHFPALFLYKAGHKDKPVRFSHMISVGHLIRWLEKHLGRFRFRGDDKTIPIDGSL